MPESPGVKEQERLRKESKNYQPPASEVEMQAFHRDRIKKAIEILNQPQRLFDNLTLLQTYKSNQDAVNSYLRPKINDDEVRIVGGTTEKRIESVVNELMSMNFQHEIRVFDKDDLEIKGLGRALDDTVTRTNQIELDDDVRSELIWELVTQPAVFIEEVFEIKKVGKHIMEMCKKRLRTCIEVFLGDPSLPAYRFQEQPYICVYERMSYPVFKQLYSNKKNFQYVMPGMNLENDVYGNNSTFRFGFLAEQEVEIVKYMSISDNEYQEYANGVPMLDVGTKMPWEYIKYPLAMVVLKPMSRFFAYGRSYASALKFLQGLSDETVRNIIRKFRQAIDPPRAVKNSQTVYAKDIYEAGKTSYGVDGDSIKKLVDHDGVTNGEMAVLGMVKEMQEELAARSSTNLGVEGQKQTATAVIQQQQESVKMLGQSVIGVSRMVRCMTDLRVCNIFENLTKPTGSYIDEVTHELRESYRQFTLKDVPLENGKTGDKIIKYSDKNLTEDETGDLHEYEIAQAEKGKPVKVTVVNAKFLRQYPMLWYTNVRSKPKETDDLDRLMFTDKFNQATQITQFTGKPMNGDQVADDFQETWRTKNWFTKAPAQPMGMPQSPTGEGISGDLTQGIGAGVKNQAMPNPTAAAAVGAVAQP